jgi:DNA-damage-inducible protein J
MQFRSLETAAMTTCHPVPTDTVVRARVSPELKREATDVLAAMGLSVSDYIRMALVRVAHDRAVPFAVEVPNALTAQTLRSSEQGEELNPAADADDLVRQLRI